MKNNFVFLLVLSMAACTFTGKNETPTVSVPTPSNPAPIPASATPVPPTATVSPSPSPTQTPAAPWWNDAVFYELTVRSFYDSNGDGIGDFNGLIEKLDYLNDGDPNSTNDLGITGLWLLPIHPSPSTHGFDVTDFYAVNPQYGTMEDFRRLVSEAHQRGIRVIIDLVLHDTSTQHPWFIQSQDPKSPYRDWYIWSDTDPGVLGAWNQKVWYGLKGDYYHALFWEGMPDLNSANPGVTAEMEKVSRFWLEDVGIDGFRLDSPGSLMRPGTESVNTQDQFDWFVNYFKFTKQVKPDAMTIGEVWRNDADVVPWVTGKQVDLAFEFDLSAAMIASINEGNSGRILETLRTGTSLFPQGQYGTFLANHDMTRILTQLGGDPQKAKAAASLYFGLPGVPFVYYGEEIGMRNVPPDKLFLPPMQWTGGPTVGFSDVTPWFMPDVDPVINVSVESGEPDSLLSHYRTLISLRSAHPALRTGSLLLPSTSNPGLFVCLRSTPDEAVLVIVNLSDAPVKYNHISLDSSALPPGEYTPVSLLGKIPLATLTVYGEGRIINYVPVAEIPPYATIMMRLQSK